MIRLISSANNRPTVSASGTGIPSDMSWMLHAAEIAMFATSDRSIPRPSTTTSIPRPRTPRTATLRISAMMLLVIRKLGRVSAHSTNRNTVNAKTIFS